MNTQSASSLFWFAVILIAAGAAAPNPGLRVILFVIAAVCAAPLAILGTGRPRLPALVVAIGACALAARNWPEFRKEMKAYGNRVTAKANKGANETRKELSKDR